MAMHTHLHGNQPELFSGRGSRVYDFIARRPLRGLYRRIVDDLVDTVPEKAAVLDVGTGPGVLLVELAQRRADLTVTGIDLSADMVAAAERNLQPFGERASARVGDVTDLPFGDDSFDVVVTSFSAHHWDHPAAAVPELDRVLRPGGKLYVYDFGHGPFDVLTDTASERALFTGGPVRRTKIRTGVLVFPRCVLQTMTA
jgi:ubiquinone/menaquinone biosynthesis C-methylase UbiE